MLTIEKLSKDQLSINLAKFLEIEQEIIAEQGEGTVITAWDANAFLSDLPEKWELSRVVLENQKPVGFLIVSVKKAADGQLCVHSHRIEILSRVRTPKLAIEIWNEMFIEARARGVSWYIGFLLAHAPDTLRFWYERALNFTILQSSDEISYFLDGLPEGTEVLDNGCIIFPSGPKKYLMAKRL
jgi:hypothetical protein